MRPMLPLTCEISITKGAAYLRAEIRNAADISQP